MVSAVSKRSSHSSSNQLSSSSNQNTTNSSTADLALLASQSQQQQFYYPTHLIHGNHQVCPFILVKLFFVEGEVDFLLGDFFLGLNLVLNKIKNNLHFDLLKIKYNKIA